MENKLTFISFLEFSDQCAREHPGMYAEELAEYNESIRNSGVQIDPVLEKLRFPIIEALLKQRVVMRLAEELIRSGADEEYAKILDSLGLINQTCT